MLREAVASGSALGARVKDFMERGNLVPDDVVIAVVADRMDHSDAANGFVLDGFPRTVAQAEALDRELAARGIGPRQSLNWRSTKTSEIMMQDLCANLQQQEMLMFGPWITVAMI